MVRLELHAAQSSPASTGKRCDGSRSGTRLALERLEAGPVADHREPQLAARPVKNHGGARVKGQGDNITLNPRGTSAEYRLSRIAH
jgi:hypothetical protein